MTTALPDFSIEKDYGGPVCGVDEAGRGALAGPVTAAAVILDPSRAPAGIDDSKRLSAARRSALRERLGCVATVGIGWASPAEIDEMNILQAALLAMQRAVVALPVVPRAALIDGNHCPALECPTRAVVKGDRRSLSISAASIVAKVERDRLMAQLASSFPHYGWRRNAGYGTAEHLRALARHGVTPHHRCSFEPVRRSIRQKPDPLRADREA